MLILLVIFNIMISKYSKIIFLHGKDEWLKKYDIYFRCSNVAVQCEDAQMYWSTLRWPIVDADHGIALTTLKAGYDTFLWGVLLYKWHRRYISMGIVVKPTMFFHLIIVTFLSKPYDLNLESSCLILGNTGNPCLKEPNFTGAYLIHLKEIRYC